MDSPHFENNFERTINCPATRANMNEPSTQHVCGAGAEAILDGCSQKILSGRAGAWNLGSVSTEIVCGVSELYK